LRMTYLFWLGLSGHVVIPKIDHAGQ
jgi:hypothetical protein